MPNTTWLSLRATATCSGFASATIRLELLKRPSRHVDLEIAVAGHSACVSLTLNRYESVATIRSF